MSPAGVRELRAPQKVLSSTGSTCRGRWRRLVAGVDAEASHCQTSTAAFGIGAQDAEARAAKNEL